MIEYLAERSTEILTGIGVGAAIYGTLYFLASRCFDDDDPDMDWRDGQQ